jgi:hypothetical protein
MELPDLLERADDVRALMVAPGWDLVLACIAAHEARSLQLLLNHTTKPEEIPRLRGLMVGLASMRDAAESIVSFAESEERKANQRLAQEHEHV